MAMRTSYALCCVCGHKGTLRVKENDAPFSKSWESYSVEGFDGEAYEVSGKMASLEEVFEAMRIVCPQCGAVLTPERVV